MRADAAWKAKRERERTKKRKVADAVPSLHLRQIVSAQGHTQKFALSTKSTLVAILSSARLSYPFVHHEKNVFTYYL